MRKPARVIQSVSQFLVCVCWLLLTLLSPDTAFANDGQTPINVATLDGAVEVANYGSYFIETDVTKDTFERRLGLSELIALSQAGAFEPITTRRIGFGQQWSVVHVRVPLINPSVDEQEFMLAFNLTPVGAAALNLVIEGEPLPEAPLLSPEDHRAWLDRDVLLHKEVTLPPNTAATLYVSFSNYGSAAPMTIERIDDYEDRRQIEEIIFHINIALIIGVALVTVTLMTAMGHPAAFAYAGYLLMICVFVYTFEDHLYRGILHQYRLFGSVFEQIVVMCGLFFYKIYLKKFLSTTPGSERFENLLLCGAWVYLLLALTHWLFEDRFLLQATIVAVIVGLLSPAAGIVALMKGQRGAWPFFFGCMVLTSSLIFKGFGGNVLSAHITQLETSRILHVAVLFEAVAFATAMMLQVRGVRMDRRDALLAQVDATRQKLQMSKALVGAAHDMRQPLAALNLALAEPGRKTSSGSLRSAVQFLDDMVSKTLAEAEQRYAAETELSDGPTTSDSVSEPYAMNTLFLHLENMLGPDARAKGLELELEDCNRVVDVNPMALMRVVANLASNAIQNTDSGKVILGCRPVQGGLEIRVTDTGPGIDSGQLDDLQRPFSRGGDYEGSGLGLSIVRQLCEDHGYGFEITSEKRRGTLARVTVPLADEQV